MLTCSGSVITGEQLQVASATARLQVTVQSVQDLPVPAIAVVFTSERRDTIFKCVWSSDVCSSDLTVIVYVAPACPCVKFPVCDFVMLRSASCVTVVASLEIGRASCRERV